MVEIHFGLIAARIVHLTEFLWFLWFLEFLKFGRTSGTPGTSGTSGTREEVTVERNSFLAGMAAGVALAYVLDPISGRRRRALVRDKFVRAGHRTREAAEGAAIDISNRARGLAAEARSVVRPEGVDDVRLIERVRAELGRVTDHPRLIEVSAMGGAVTLRGPVLAEEADRIVKEVRSISGVNAIYDRLDRHATPDIPALQGARS